MGQISNAPVLGIAVLPTDRESGPGAGPGATGNNSIFFGLNAGQNATINNLIVIGNNAGKGGLTDATLAGTTILGVGSAAALKQNSTIQPAYTNCDTILGSSNIPLAVAVDTTIMVGQGNFPLFGAAGGTITDSIYIGNAIFKSIVNGSNNQSAIIIGNNAFNSSLLQCNQSVVIGAHTCQAALASGQDVIIGYNALNTASGAGQDNVFIGGSVDAGTIPTNNVVVGFGATCNGASTTLNTLVGALSHCNGNLNTALGFKAGSAASGLGNVFIGVNAGTSLTVSNKLVIACSTAIGGGSGNTALGLVYGDFVNSNIAFGAVVVGTNDDFGGAPGTNMVKLLNGTKATGANIVGGGYFYVSAGALHWVGSSGTDTTLAVA